MQAGGARGQVHGHRLDCLEVPRSRLCRSPGHETRAAPGTNAPLSGLAGATSCTVAELEVSGLRGGWAGFQERRLILATKTESSSAGGETGERTTAAWTGAAQKTLELEMIPERPVLFCFVLFPKGKIRRAQSLIWTWVRVG